MIKHGRTFLKMTGIIIAAVYFLTACERKKTVAAPNEQSVFEGTVVAVGDSLTAGYGVKDTEAYPARLEKKLREAGYSWRVINAGNSGETSSGTLTRITWVLRLKPDIVILETGANDGLRGIDPQVMKKNIDETVRILKENKVTVILAGMQMVTNMGRDYTNSFAAIYPTVARKHDLTMVPFFLAEVAGKPSLNQSDGIHPLPEGYRIVAETVYPYVRQAIDRKIAGRTSN